MRCTSSELVLTETEKGTHLIKDVQGANRDSTSSRSRGSSASVDVRVSSSDGAVDLVERGSAAMQEEKKRKTNTSGDGTFDGGVSGSAEAATEGEGDDGRDVVGAELGDGVVDASDDIAKCRTASQ